MMLATSPITIIPDSCDYLVVGAGATGMAFIDSLIQGLRQNSSATKPSIRIVLLDQHDASGGQWNVSYDFVRLHQPSAMYGVESKPLEPSPSGVTHKNHRATRQEILDYYATLVKEWSASTTTTTTTSPGDVSFTFLGRATFDFGSIHATDQEEVSTRGGGMAPRYQFSIASEGASSSHHGTITPFSIQVHKRLVDARYLEPDLPISTAPKFDFDPSKIHCIAVNCLVGDDDDGDDDDGDDDDGDDDDGDDDDGDDDDGGCDTNIKNKNKNNGSNNKNYVVIGAGKTGMDAIVYLLTKKHVPPSHILWIAPHDPWITARENIGNCMEFLRDITRVAKQDQQQQQQQQQQHHHHQQQQQQLDLTHTRVVQETFQQWERQGHVYRLFAEDSGVDDEDTKVAQLLPTKFNDATLCQEELATLRRIPPTHVVRGRGRVSRILPDTGALQMQDGSFIPLPWSAAGEDTIYVHCSAGAFNYTKQFGCDAKPVFDAQRKIITLQDIYGTPGFCFVGSLLGKLESLVDLALNDNEKNAMCRVPTPPPLPSSTIGTTAANMLGPSGGTVMGLSKDHGLVQRLCNLRNWLQVPQLRDWLIGHRLFNLGHYDTADDIQRLVDEAYGVLNDAGLVEE